MADLLTHLATVYVPTRLGVRDPAARSLAYLGVCLPDLLSRAGIRLGVPGRLSFHDIVHTPAFLVLASAAAAQLFAGGWRIRAFLALLFGGLVHLLVDAGKDTLGLHGVLWGWPWSLQPGEWGLYLPEHTVYFMAPAVLSMVLARTIGRRWDDRGLPPPAGDSRSAA